MPDRTVSDVIVAQLSSWGVEYIFGLSGTTCFGLVDAICRQEGVTFVKVRHEEAADASHVKVSRHDGGRSPCCNHSQAGFS